MSQLKSIRSKQPKIYSSIWCVQNQEGGVNLKYIVLKRTVYDMKLVPNLAATCLVLNINSY